MVTCVLCNRCSGQGLARLAVSQANNKKASEKSLFLSLRIVMVMIIREILIRTCSSYQQIVSYSQHMLIMRVIVIGRETRIP